MGRVLQLILILVFSSYCVSEESVLVSNSWAVEVRGGSNVAEQVARRHGFVNKGLVGNLLDVYHFVHVFSPTRARRNANEIHPKHLHLQSEDYVGYVEQQVIKQRFKRDDYSPPSSTKWEKQWYLNRPSGHNLNVESAWEQNITGKGAVVSILDDGIEYSHPDFQNSYDPLASYDFNDHDSDPIPRYDPTNENKHGTRCAGEVAAMKGSRCGVGVAYDSKIGGVRMLDGDVTDVVEASSLSLKPQHIDIYSSSWGPNDDGKTVDGPGKLASKAFFDGVTYGRNGLGSIFVWAAGNGGRYEDSCNCDGYAVSPLTISVGSASEHDKRPWYLEMCPSTLVSTYSSGGVTEKQIITSDLRGGCTERHTGTSASAPLAAGMMALALEANSHLTWRDMQYLMVYSSNPQYPDDDEWHKNGAGLKVSHWYGFGIIDGAALVNRARNWVTVPARSNCSFNVTAHSKIATSDSPLVIDVNAEDCSLVYLEHVQAVTSLRLKAGMRKDVSIFIVSPAGTKSMLLPNRPRDRHKDGFHLWPFMTVHSWGEQPQGNWIFNVHVKQRSVVELVSLELILYGTQSMPLSVLAIPTQCHSQCLHGCAREGAQYCDVCKHYRISNTSECVETCPLGTYSNKNVCRYCPTLCAECTNVYSCTRCQSHVFRLPDGTCSEQCSDGAFAASNNSCIPCYQSCMTCDGPLGTDCTSCHPQFTLHDRTCVIRDPTSCPVGQYFDHRAHDCRLCHQSCTSCTGKESIHCTSCTEGSLISLEGQCVDSRKLRSCYSGQYFDGTNLECTSCPSSCGNCSNNLTCTTCPQDLYLTSHGDCVEVCPLNTVGEGSLCLDVHCHRSCLTCFGSGSVHCKSCSDGLLLFNNNLCMENCPPHFFKNNSACKTCHKDCKSCEGSAENQCLTCPPEKVLVDGKCVLECPTGSYKKYSLCFKCRTSNCLNCGSQDSCIQCENGYYLFCSPLCKCVARCPFGFAIHAASRSCQPCPANCAVCSSTSMCSSCQRGHVYYAPSGMCLNACPEGYYSSPTGNCISCSPPCSTCIGFASNCSSCSTGMAYDTISQVCRECCSVDKTSADCCDCNLDNVVCHWPDLDGVVTPNTHILVGAGITIILVFLLFCIIFILAIVRRYSFKLTKLYQKVPDHTSDSDSDINITDTGLLS